MPDQEAGHRQRDLLITSADLSAAERTFGSARNPLAAALAMLVVSAGAGLGFAASTADAAEKRYGLTSFTRVDVQVNAEVEIVTRSPVSAMASGDQDALDRLVVDARDGRLVISSRQFAGDEKRQTRGQPLRLKIYAPAMNSISLNGAGTLSVDKLRGQRVTISLRGPGAVRVQDVESDHLALNMMGNGEISLAGNVKKAQLMVAGAGQLAASDLLIDDLTLESEGAADVALHAVKRANIVARGAGQVSVAGRPSCSIRNIGSGSLRCGGDAPR